MDDATIIGAEISKINFLLENLYALVLRDAGAHSSQIAGLAEEMRRQATELHAAPFGSGSADTGQLQEIVGARLDTFWARVRDRLASQE